MAIQVAVNVSSINEIEDKVEAFAYETLQLLEKDPPNEEEITETQPNGDHDIEKMEVMKESIFELKFLFLFFFD